MAVTGVFFQGRGSLHACGPESGTADHAVPCPRSQVPRPAPAAEATASALNTALGKRTPLRAAGGAPNAIAAPRAFN